MRFLLKQFTYTGECNACKFSDEIKYIFPHLSAGLTFFKFDAQLTYIPIKFKQTPAKSTINNQ